MMIKNGIQGDYSFTGKERDLETGFGYFGARYMDHELMTMWLSVDPLADKYPGVTSNDAVFGRTVICFSSSFIFFSKKNKTWYCILWNG